MTDKEVDPFRFNSPIYVLCEGPADVRLVTRLLQREDLDGFSVNYARVTRGSLSTSGRSGRARIGGN